LSIRRILHNEHPALRGHARPVEKINHVILRLLDDMTETMHEAKGVGLAAPQIGIAKRLITVAPGEEEPVWQLINPRILDASGEAVDVEGCLSIPGVYGEVPRYEQITVEAQDRDGQMLKLNLSGFHARIFQHEIDHLDGILFIDRATRLLDPAELKREEAE
jgi:peptide deformylase